jgi:serine/threonine protein kinase
MATVYAAIHPLIGKRAAIKVMTPVLSADAGAVVRFVQEARAVNQIRHPNIVDVFSFGRLPDGRSYLVMEWLQGETLHQRMTRPLGLPETLEILDQICDALEAAHDKQIIHRDIKPANVFLSPVRGRAHEVKLLDFGVAKLCAPEDQLPSTTRTGFVVGTPEYISPEQARGKNVDHRTDIYALGAVVFEMVLGRPVFEADNPMDVVRLHMTDEPPRPRDLWRDIPPTLEALILGMLEKRPDRRPSLTEIRQAVRELKLRAMPPPRSRVVRGPGRRRFGQRRLQLTVGVAALGSGIMLLLALGVRSGGRHAADAMLSPAVAASPPPPTKPAPAALPSVVAQPRPAAPRATRPRSGQPQPLPYSPDRDYLVDPFAAPGLAKK